MRPETAVRSAPFDQPGGGRVAVKVVTHIGMEMTTVVDLPANPDMPPCS